MEIVYYKKSPLLLIQGSVNLYATTIRGSVVLGYVSEANPKDHIKSELNRMELEGIDVDSLLQDKYIYMIHRISDGMLQPCEYITGSTINVELYISEHNMQHYTVYKKVLETESETLIYKKS